MDLKKWTNKNKKIELRYFNTSEVITLLVEHPQNVAYKDRYLYFSRYNKANTFLILKKLFFARG